MNLFLLSVVMLNVMAPQYLAKWHSPNNKIPILGVIADPLYAIAECHKSTKRLLVRIRSSFLVMIIYNCTKHYNY